MNKIINSKKSEIKVSRALFIWIILLFVSLAGVNALIIGGRDTGYFNGTIDEVRVWDRVLSAAEALQHYYSNLNKYSAEGWGFYTNQSDLTDGDYTYQGCAEDEAGNVNCTEVRSLTVGAEILDTIPPSIEFVPPTSLGPTQPEDYILVNVSASDVGKGGNNISTFIDFDRSLVLWMRFNESSLMNGSNVTDFSGYGNNGTVYANDSSGNARDISSEGYFGRGGSFDGDGDYINISSSNGLNITKEITLSAWVKPVSLGQNIGGIVERTQTYRLLLWKDDRFVFDYFNSSGDSCGSSSPANSINANVWYHIVGVKNTTGTSLYVNGLLNDSDNCNVGDMRSSGIYNVEIGRRDLRSNTSFNGTIDDVMIFNRSLSADEIKGLYANTSSKYLMHNFTDLADGNHTFKAYAQDRAGNVNVTGERKVEILPTATNCVFNSDDTLIENLYCSTNLTIAKDVKLDSGGFNITVGEFGNIWGRLDLMPGSKLNFSSSLGGFFDESNGTLNALGSSGDNVLVTGEAGWNFDVVMNVTSNYTTFEFMDVFWIYEWRGGGGYAIDIDNSIFQNATDQYVVRMETKPTLSFKNNIIHTTSNNNIGLYWDSDEYLNNIINLTIDGPNPVIQVHNEKVILINSTFSEVRFIINNESSLISINHNDILNDIVIWPGNSTTNTLSKSQIPEINLATNLTIRKDMLNHSVRFRIDEDMSLYQWNMPCYGFNSKNKDYILKFVPGITITFDDNAGAGFARVGDCKYEQSAGVWSTYGATRLTAYINGTSDNWITFTSSNGKYPVNHWAGFDNDWGVAGKREYMLVQGHKRWIETAYGNPEVDNSIFESGSGSYTLKLRDANAIYSNIIVRDSVYGLTKYGDARMINFTIENITNYDVLMNFMNKYPAEFINSSFNVSKVEFGDYRYNQSMISKNHNDNIGDYLIFVNPKPSRRNSSVVWTTNYLRKSWISNDFTSSDNVTLMSGRFIIDEDANASWFNVTNVSNASVTVLDGVNVRLKRLSLYSNFSMGDGSISGYNGEYWDADFDNGNYSFMGTTISYGNNIGNEIIYVLDAIDGGNNIPDGMWVFGDNQAPAIWFENSTTNGAIDYNWIFVNVTANDTGRGDSNISTFIDFDDSLVLWVRFSEDSLMNGSDVTDFSGYGNNGTVYANDSNGFARDISTSDGYFGRGASFDGDGDYINISSDNGLNITKDITLSAWVKPITLEQSTVGIVEKTQTYRLLFWSDDRFTFNYFNSSYDSCGSTSVANSINANVWYHVVGVRKITGTSLYINGLLNDSDNCNIGDIRPSDIYHVEIGRRDLMSNYSFNGSIDDVMIFNRSLSAEEISGLYANTSSKYLEHTFSGLSDGDHTFKAYAQDRAGNVDSTETRRVSVDATAPGINFTSPTPVTNTNTTNTSVEIRINITEANLEEVKWNWDDNNYTIYDDSLVLMMNFDNVSALGENENITKDSSKYGNDGIIVKGVNVTGNNVRFNSSLCGSWAKLRHRTIYPNSENVTDYLGDTIIYPSSDYTIDYQNGLINVSCSGTMQDNTFYYIDYRYNISGAEYTTGRYGTALEFDGADDYVDAGNDESLDITDEITLEAWINLNDITGNFDNDIILNKEGIPYEIAIGDTIGGGSYEYHFTWHLGGVATNAPNIGASWYDGGGPINRGEWTHLALTYNGSNIITYINGNLEKAYNGSNQIQTTGRGLRIGARNSPGPASAFFNGTIDEVRIYNRSLSAEEIKQQYYSNLRKYNVDKWEFYVNENYGEPKDFASYNYYGCAEDIAGNKNCTETRTLNVNAIYPGINFTSPTPENNTNTTNTSVEIKINITEANLEEVKWNWDDNNYTIYDDSLVLMYNFDNVSSLEEDNENVIDLSGYGNDGVIYGAEWSSDGRYNGAFEFDADVDYIDAGNRESLNIKGNQMTVMGWFKKAGRCSGTNQPCLWDPFVSKWNYTLGAGYRTFWLGLTDYDEDDEFSPYFGIFNTSDMQSSARDYNTVIQMDKWYHITGVYNGSAVSVYLNGQFINSSTAHGELEISDVSVYIGGSANGENRFNGTIDEVRIYNRSLSADEIKQQYYSNLRKYDTDKWEFYSNQSNLAEGVYTYYGYVEDRAGNSNQTETRTLTVDTPPIITLNAPEDNSNWNTSSIVFNWTAVDINGIICNLTVDGVVNRDNVIVTSGVAANETIGVGEGTHYWNITCWDSTGKSATTATYGFFVDSVYPNISFAPSTDSGNLLRDNIFVNVSAADDNNISTFIDFDDSLRLWLRMDDFNGSHVMDYMGRYHGYINGSPTQIDTGYIGKAFEFEGGNTNDYIDVDYRAVDGLEDFSVSFWLRKDDNDYEAPISSANNEVLQANEFLIYTSQNALQVHLGGVSDSWPVDFGDGKWHHVIFTRNGTTGIVYTDGLSKGNNVVNGTPLDVKPGGFILGQEQDSVGGTFVVSQALNGSIDDLMIFDRVLSKEEVRGLYANQSSRQLIHNFTSLADGSHTFKAYAQDIAGNVNYTEERTIMTDVTPPSIILNHPENNSNLNTSLIVFNWTAVDVFGITCNLTIDGIVNKDNLNVISGVAYNETIAGLSEGVHYWNVTCWDSTGNSATTATYKFLVDSVYPNISFAPSTDSGTLLRDNIFVNVSAADENNISTFIDFDDSLVGWWRFSESSLNNGSTLYDYSDYGNDGIIRANDDNGNARDISTGAGYFGRGAEFDGKEDYVVIPDNESLRFRTGTWSLWVWVNETQRTSIAAHPNRILYKGMGHNGWSMGVDSSVDDGPVTSFYFAHSIYYDPPPEPPARQGGWSQSLYSSSSGYLEKWTHIVFTVDELDTVRLYLDGDFKDDKIWTDGGIVISDSYLAISPGSRWFTGKLDDIMLLNRVLSAEEIRGLYANQSNRYLANNFTDLADGPHIFKAYTQDIAGNVNETEERTVTTDANIPIITASSPSGIVPTWTFTLSVTTNENTTCRYVSGTEGNITTTYENMTYNFSDDNLQHTKTLTLDDGYHEYYARCIDNSGNVMTQSENISFTVDVETITIFVTTSAGGGGSSARRVVSDNIILDLYAPINQTLLSGDEKSILLKLKNKGDVKLNNIRLNAQTNAPDLGLSLSEYSVDQLNINEENYLTLNLKSLTQPTAHIGINRYFVTVEANVTNFGYKTSIRFFIDIEEKDYQARLETLKNMEFVEDLFEENPQCLEFSDKIEQAKEAYDVSDYDKALSLIDSAIQACRDLIAPEGEGIEQPAPKKKVNMLLLLIEVTVLLALLLAMFYYYKRRPKPVKIEAKLGLEGRYRALFRETKKLLMKKDAAKARKGYIRLYSLYKEVLESSLPASVKTHCYKRLIKVYSGLSKLIKR